MLRFYANLKALHEEVTGSAIPVTIYFPDNTEVSFVVDYGMFQENKYTEKNRGIKEGRVQSRRNNKNDEKFTNNIWHKHRKYTAENR